MVKNVKLYLLLHKTMNNKQKPVLECYLFTASSLPAAALENRKVISCLVIELFVGGTDPSGGALKFKGFHVASNSSISL